MYKIDNKVVHDLNNFACAKCGLRATWFVRYGFITIYCNACNHMEKAQKIETYIPNPDAPWRK